MSAAPWHQFGSKILAHNSQATKQARTRLETSGILEYNTELTSGGLVNV